LPLVLAYPVSALALRKAAGRGCNALTTALMPVAVFGLMFVLVAPLPAIPATHFPPLEGSFSGP
jgi:hypothetical protein